MGRASYQQRKLGRMIDSVLSVDELVSLARFGIMFRGRGSHGGTLYIRIICPDNGALGVASRKTVLLAKRRCQQLGIVWPPRTYQLFGHRYQIDNPPLVEFRPHRNPRKHSYLVTRTGASATMCMRDRLYFGTAPQWRARGPPTEPVSLGCVVRGRLGHLPVLTDSLTTPGGHFGTVMCRLL